MPILIGHLMRVMLKYKYHQGNSAPRSLWEMPDLVYFILDRNFTKKITQPNPSFTLSSTSTGVPVQKKRRRLKTVELGTVLQIVNHGSRLKFRIHADPDPSHII